MNLAEALLDNASLRQQNAQLLAKLEEFEHALAALKAESEELRQRLGLNSQTSSLPPSSDGCHKPPPRKRSPSERKPGGQPGHKGTTLRQIDSPDTRIELYPDHCQRCQASLEGQPSQGKPIVRQVFDLPPDLRLRVTQHEAHAVHCPQCGQKNRAAFPAGVVNPTQYGSDMKGLMAYLHDAHLMPYGRSAELLRNLVKSSVCPATLVNTTREMNAALASRQAERETQLAAAAVSHADETGLRVAGKLYWVHVHCAEGLAQLYLSAHRGRKAMGHLAQKRGVVVHDGLASYHNFGAFDHALCNAHHLRELEFLSLVRGREWARWLQQLLLEALRETDQARNRGQTALDVGVLEACRARFEAIVQAAIREQPPPQARPRGRLRRSKELNLLRRLERGMDALWLFASDFRVPFTNNLAERSLRMLKVKMKVSGGFRTLLGAQRHVAIRSALLTAQACQQAVLEMLQTSYHDWRTAPSSVQG